VRICELVCVYIHVCKYTRGIEGAGGDGVVLI